MNINTSYFEKRTSLFNSQQFDDIEIIPSIFANQAPEVAGAQTDSRIAKFFRQRFIQLFSKLQESQIILIDPLGKQVIGSDSAELKCTVTVGDIRSYTQVALYGASGSGQAYIEGLWTVDNLSQLIRIFVRNREVLLKMESGLARFAQWLYRGWHAMNRNTRNGSRKNIAAHYDLGNDFFRLFLDQRMMYSSALYEQGDDLDQASDRKLQRICDSLELSSDDHIVEIGSGWGGFACYAASTTGCQVTTVTISQEQFEEAQKQVQEQGLQNLVTVKLQDYRDIEGRFDKLVSIEMIEAVGHQYLDTYFKKINHLLKPEGKAMIQAIVIDDKYYKSALKRVDFIKRYIFPGGFMPCYSVIGQTAGQNKLMLEDLHDMGLSYAQTLRDWRKRFYAEIPTITQKGYDPAFQRMWEFYLCYCEGGFDERSISVGQILFQKQSEAD